MCWVGSHVPAQQSLVLLHGSPAPAHVLVEQETWQTPWLPGAPPVEQHCKPPLHAFWVPVVQGSPTPAAVGLQPTEAEVQTPCPPGALPVAQQTSVVFPQAFCVPVVQGQPIPGRVGSVQ